MRLALIHRSYHLLLLSNRIKELIINNGVNPTSICSHYSFFYVDVIVFVKLVGSSCVRSVKNPFYWILVILQIEKSVNNVNSNISCSYQSVYFFFRPTNYSANNVFLKQKKKLNKFISSDFFFFFFIGKWRKARRWEGL